MKAGVILLFFCLLLPGGWLNASDTVSFDSLKKGDWLTFECVNYYPYVAPGIREEIPWRAENIQRLVFTGTVKEKQGDRIVFDYTLDYLYDCRNDHEKQGFYYFDSRYQKDFIPVKDPFVWKKGEFLSEVSYDINKEYAKALESVEISYPYSKVYIPFGVKSSELKVFSQDSISHFFNLGDILNKGIPSFLYEWGKKRDILTTTTQNIGSDIFNIRIVNASFPLPSNVKVDYEGWDKEKRKKVKAYKEFFIAYPMEYLTEAYQVIYLSPGDSVIQYRDGRRSSRFKGRGAAQNNFIYKSQYLVYGYYKYDMSDPDKVKRAFHLRDSAYQSTLKDDFLKMDPYWRRVYELSENYAKNQVVIDRYLKSADKKSWENSGLLDWNTNSFQSVNPLIDWVYSLKMCDISFYKPFLYAYADYKKDILTRDNLNRTDAKELNLRESYYLNKLQFSCYPKYRINAQNLKEMMYNNMLSSLQEEYDEFMMECPDTMIQSELKDLHDDLLIVETGRNLKDTGLALDTCLALKKGSNRKYILMNASLLESEMYNYKDVILSFKNKIDAAGLDGKLQLSILRTVPYLPSDSIKSFFGVISPYVILDILKKFDRYNLTVLMREDGTILYRKFMNYMSVAGIKQENMSQIDIDHIIKLVNEDMNRKDPPVNYWPSFIIGFSIAFVLGFVMTIYQKLKRRKEKSRRYISELELRAIRSQMNPHFIFNALGSIQNLINRSANKEANEYLINFSRLLRKVLATSEKKLVSLTDEIEQLRLYLSLEQLRVPFTYQLTVSDNLETDLVEIPGMLIQPFVENAVKHGIAPRGNGEINIDISLHNSVLVITITDDGPGFDIDKTEGFGVRAITSQFEVLKTLYNTEVGVKIENRQDKESVSGCRVILSIPL